ncbi:MAG: hypothetical protein NZ742_08375 [Acidobacteria bacterium]|nr:hypothetical protein [Acidobacteriota bacterium]MDW7984788.1 hypothetical protein [Acidobacteriota bacterium]
MARVDVRVLEALPPAWSHVRQVLFRPFGVGRWLTFGFWSFLQGLGEGGFSIGLPDFWGHRWAEQLDRAVLLEVLRRVSEYLPAVLAICGILLVLGIGFVLLLMWLSARGTFAYLDCIATNRPEVRRPWREHRAIAHSYFILRVIFGLVALAIMVALTVPVGVLVMSRLRTGEGLRATSAEVSRSFSFEWSRWDAGYGMAIQASDADEDRASIDPVVLIVLIVGFALLILVVLASTVFNVLLVDFVVPVQYLMKVGAFEALKIVWTLMVSHLGGFVLYLIVRLVLASAIGCGIFAVGCLTCGAFFCITAIPVLSQTVLQPVYALFRTFPLFVLRQFGPEWDVFVSSSPGPLSGVTPLELEG